MIFGIGQLQEGLNESDDRYQTKRLNNLKLYNLFRETFPTASITDHQNFINNMAGGDRWLRGQLPSEDALKAYDRERTRLTREREEDRKYQQFTRQVKMNKDLDDVISSLAETGIDAKDIEKNIFARFGRDSQIGQMFDKRFVNNQPALTSRITNARTKRARTLFADIKPLNLSEADTKAYLENIGYKPGSHIYKQVVASNIAHAKDRANTKFLEAIPALTNASAVIEKAMHEDHKAVVAELKKQASSLGLSPTDAQIANVASNVIASAKGKAPAMEAEAVGSLESVIKTAAMEMSLGILLEEDVRAKIEKSLIGRFPEAMKKRILDRAVEEAKTLTSNSLEQGRVTKENEAKEAAQVQIKEERKETTKDVVERAGNSIALMIAPGDDNLSIEDDEGSTLYAARVQLAAHAKTLLDEGVSREDIVLAINTIRDSKPGMKVPFEVITPDNIKTILQKANRPTSWAARQVKRQQDLTSKIMDPEKAEKIINVATSVALKTGDESLDAVRKFANDRSQNSKTLASRIKQFNGEVDKRIAELEGYVNNPRYALGRDENFKKRISKIIDQLKDYKKEASALQHITYIERGPEINQLNLEASGGDPNITPAEYRRALRNELAVIQQKYLITSGKTIDNMFRAAKEKLYERPGYERLRPLLTGDLKRGDLGRFRQEMKRISENKTALMRESEAKEKRAIELTANK